MNKKIIFNNKSCFKYIILKRFECGLVLTGHEVKSLRILNSLQIKNSRFFFSHNEIFISGFFIKLFNFSNKSCSNLINLQCKKKKLLLKKKEFFYLRNLQHINKQVVFLLESVYWLDSWIKISLIIGKKREKKADKCKKYLLKNISTT